eukprot:CAMPEP_0113597410 /NCGR_PEP_ID=MMETSP0015_2-20120614/40988_1 /TAXON_ID=2838 /ORGANISM="Odontella" /LENGTH=472 /DNA_ID=CAMNT_0000505257 /DNA_START=70 /DNA_END=1488 /DNA_ORIENTATION=- /assembly_acc=CAM_ASM_000160
MTSSLLSSIEYFDMDRLKATETKVTRIGINGETPTASSTPAAPNRVLDASSNAMHGKRGCMSWEPPLTLRYVDVEARPGYASCKAHEYVDRPEVLRAKVKLLADLIRGSEQCVAYTGAGISTSAGIADYATQGDGVFPLLLSPMLAKPTPAHRILASLHAEGHLKHWIQQNHDGLPQKAGYPQHALNEIHGAWYDPSNPVVPMDGGLRPDLFKSLLLWEKKADLCIAIGTSLAGMNADRVVRSVSERATSGEGLGSVIISLQQTPLDELSALRIFGKIDDVMEMLAEELSITQSSVPTWDGVVGGDCGNGNEGCEEDMFMIPYNSSGNKMSPGNENNCLDLREGQQVRITSGFYSGDVGVVVGKQLEGHYKIRFMHPIKNKGWLAPKVHVLGCWMLVEAMHGLLDTFPIVTIAGVGDKGPDDTGEAIMFKAEPIQNKNQIGDLLSDMLKSREAASSGGGNVGNEREADCKSD